MGRHAHSFGRLRDLSTAMAAKQTSASALVEQALDRIEAIDGAVQAFLSVDAEGARDAAAKRDQERAAGRLRGPLHGVPIAVKDVIDVAGVPTRAGSRARADAPPAAMDATMVARLKAGGAIVVGKVHTTEFAYFSGVPPTRNPHDVGRTPGGSSGGSAAAVASGSVPLSLGTQTAGSVNRPAAFCGVGAFKPTGLSVVGAGVTPFAPSFDTIGTFAETAADAAFALAAFAPEAVIPGASGQVSLNTIVLLEDPKIDAIAGPEILMAVNAALDEAAATGCLTRRAPSPIAFADLLANHRTMMMFELGRVQGGLLERRDLIDPVLADGIIEGASIDEATYLDAVNTLTRLRREFWAAMPLPNAVMFPAAPGVAPEGVPTGDPTLVTIATALGGPTATVRAGICEQTSMPLGALVAMAPGADAAFATSLLTALEGPLAR